jgi:hypothetical protein
MRVSDLRLSNDLPRFGAPENQRNWRLSAGRATRHVPTMTRSFPRSILALALCVLVTGCLTTEQQAARNNERCAARGYKPETKEFNDCLTQLETERSLRMQTRHQEMLEKSAAPSSNRGY